MLLRVSFLGCADANGQDPVGVYPGCMLLNLLTRRLDQVVSGITVSHHRQSTDQVSTDVQKRLASSRRPIHWREFAYLRETALG